MIRNCLCIEFVCVIVLFFSGSKLSSQILITPNELGLHYWIFENDEQKRDALFPKFHSNSDSDNNCILNFQSRKRTSWTGRKIFEEHFLQVDSPAYSLYADPAVQFSLGKERGYEPLLYENTRGIRIRGDLQKKLFFSSEVYETQSVFPTYLEAFADSFEVAPGLIRAKEFKESGRDYSLAYGILAWEPVNRVRLIFGRDKQHFGYGYRSLMLSHNAPASTFFRVDAKYKKWVYHFILSSLQNVSLQNVIDVPRSSLGGYQNKYANFLILTYRPVEQLELSIFESMIWAPFSHQYNRLHLKHFNPLPLTRTVYYGLDDPNNTMAGIQLRLSLPMNFMFYSQYVLDEVGSIDKSAFQAGLVYKRISDCQFITARVEFNSAGAYTYTNSDPLQSYTHYHHSLAHPLGANFREYLAQLTWNSRRWIAYAMFSFVRGGVDTPYETTGQSMYADPAFANWQGGFFPMLTSGTASMYFADVRLHYVINRASGLHVFAGAVYRKTKSAFSAGQTIDVHGGISTNLRFYCKHQSWL